LRKIEVRRKARNLVRTSEDNQGGVQMIIRKGLIIFFILISSVAFAQQDTSLDIPQLIERLKDDKKEIRHQAAYDLGNIGKPAVPALLKELEKESTDTGQDEIKRAHVIHAVTIALGLIKDKSTVPNLFDLLKDKDGNVIMYATEALCMMQDEAMLGKLIKIMLDQEKYMEQYESEHKEATPEELAEKTSPYVITAMSINAGIANASEVVFPTLLKVTEDKDWQIRDYAIGASYDIFTSTYSLDKQALIQAIKARLNDENETVRDKAKEVLSRLGESK